MTELELAYIEKELDIQLPEEYKKEALEEKLVQTHYEEFLLNDAKRIVSVNKRLRKSGMSGVRWRYNHFVFGLDESPRGYYYIDVNEGETSVYFTNRTKSWKYSPDNMSYNKRLGLCPISKFVRFHVEDDLRIKKYENMPVVELTDEEKRVKREAFFAELWKSKGKQRKE